MRLRRVRCTIRRMMLTIGLAALLMWPTALGRYYRGVAFEHDLQFDRVYQAMQGSPEWKEWERLNLRLGRSRVGPRGSARRASHHRGRARVSDDLEQRYGAESSTTGPWPASITMRLPTRGASSRPIQHRPTDYRPANVANYSWPGHACAG